MTEIITIPLVSMPPPRPAVSGRLYLTPFRVSVDRFEVDDAGTPWGFSEYAELLADPVEAIEVAAKSLDAMGGRLVVKWSKAAPYPHYRVTRQRCMELRRAGCELVDEQRAEEIRQDWGIA